MNCSSSFLVKVMALAAVISFFSGVVVAQAAAPMRVLPCETDSTRAVLKRRQPLPDSSSGAENSTAQEPQDKPKCEPLIDAQRIKEQDLVTVQFKGLEALDDFDVRERLRERNIIFSGTVMPDLESTNKAAALVKELLQAQGYLQATVDVLTDDEARAVKFIVAQGPRLPIAAVNFTGNRIFTSHDLAASMEECVADNQEWSDEGHAPPMFEYCLRRATNFMRSQGYLQSQLGSPENQITPKGLVVTIPVKERALYRFGEIKIEGAEAITVERLTSRFPLGRGDIANGEALGKWVYEDLRKLYGNLGYIQFTAEINPEFKTAAGSNEGVVDVNITIDEGRQFRLSSLKFVGASLPEQQMRKLFPMNDGEPYSQQLFEAGIKKLNETGWLEFVDGDKDSDFKTDDEGGTVTIVIKVSRNGTNPVELQRGELK